MDMYDINSQEYWDLRFNTDWESKGGSEQTKYFTKLALSILPKNFVDLVKKNRLSLMDWGCAEGEGTSILTEELNSSKVIGLDFASSAIQKARTNHPNCVFLDGKIEDYNEMYDVIFTSNCLEHYENPFDWMNYLFQWTRHFLIVLIPFQEEDRNKEHFYTFDYEMFNLKVNNFNVIFHKEVEADPKYWKGKQLLLIYANNNTDLYDSLKLDVYKPNEFDETQRKYVLSELTNDIKRRDEIISFIQKENTVNKEWIQVLQDEVQKREESIKLNKKEMKEKDEWIKSQQEEIAQRDVSVKFLKKEIKEKDVWIEKLKQEVKKRDESVAYLTNKVDPERGL